MNKFNCYLFICREVIILIEFNETITQYVHFIGDIYILIYLLLMAILYQKFLIIRQ